MTAHGLPEGDGQISSQGIVTYAEGRYASPVLNVGLMGRLFPSLTMYQSFLRNVWRSSRRARQGVYDFDAWVASSVEVMRTLERVGVRFDIRGLEHLQHLDGPCVIIGNHMSTLETTVLPAIIGSVRPVTFILKDSLFRTPVFCHVVRAINPIGVTRINPRADLKTVMEEGDRHLQCGDSIAVFPQTTRTTHFDATQFSSIGVKLALRSKVPVVPLAIRSDAWANGRWIKDAGVIDPSKPVRFAFGEPFDVADRGRDQHQRVIDFIDQQLATWIATDGEL